LQRTSYVTEAFNAGDVDRAAAEEDDEHKVVPKYNEIVVSLEDSLSVAPEVSARSCVEPTDVFFEPGKGETADGQTNLNVVHCGLNRELFQC
jgi:hypothetical protein